MKDLLSSRTTLIWLLLVAATVVSWEIGHGVGFKNTHYASVAIIIVAFVKVRFVILDFMEIRNAPVTMRIVGETAVIVLCTVLVTLYLRTPR